MLRLATAVLLVLWLLGIMTGFTLNSFIHSCPSRAGYYHRIDQN